MTTGPDDDSSPLTLAERAVKDGEARLQQQERILADIRRDHVPSAAEAAQAVLEQLQQSLEWARQNLERLKSRTF